VSTLLHDLDQGMQPISVLAPYLPTAKHAARDKARVAISELFRPIIAARRSGATRGDDMLQWLCEATYRGSGDPFSDDEIVGCLIAGLFAAQHTSSSTVSWMGMRLAHEPEVMARVRAEQEALLGGGAELDYAVLSKMDLMHAVMKETLRMHPPLIFLMRKVMEPRTALGGKYDIPVGDYLFVSPSISGMLPDVYAEPEKFDPDRFLAPRLEDRAAPYSYLAFGSGRHACMGEMFGYLQVKTVWSTVLRLFDIEAVGDTMPLPSFDALVVGPQKGTCMIRYKRRRV
jgi:sterol 14alpha-demethylase